MKNFIRLLSAVFLTWTSMSFAFEASPNDCPGGRCRDHTFDVLHCAADKKCGFFEQVKESPDGRTWCGFDVSIDKRGSNQGYIILQYGFQCSDNHRNVYHCMENQCWLHESEDSGAPPHLSIDPKTSRLTLTDSYGRNVTYGPERKFFNVEKVRWDEIKPSGSRPTTTEDTWHETEIFYLKSDGQRVSGVIYDTPKIDGKAAILGKQFSLSKTVSITTRNYRRDTDQSRWNFATADDVGSVVVDCDGKAMGVIVGFDSEFTYLLPWSPSVPSSRNAKRIQ